MDGLDALDNLVEETDAANPGPEQRQQEQREQEEAEQIEQGAKDWAMVPFMIGGLATMFAPELAPVYTKERCLIWGRHANQVAVKWGWNSPSNMPELGLAACTISFALPTFLVLREKLREMKEGKASGLMAKVGLWWRSRKAAKAAKATGATDTSGDGARDGVKQ